MQDDGNLFQPQRPVAPSNRLPVYRVSAQRRTDGAEVMFEAASIAIAVQVANDFQRDGYKNISVKWPDKASGPDSEDGHIEWRRHRRRDA